MVPKNLLIGSSIIKYVRYLPNTDVKSFPGTTVKRLTKAIDDLIAIVAGYRLIIILVGTNDLHSSTVQQFIIDYSKLLDIVKFYSQTSQIIVSGLIPRPCDFETHGQKLKQFNKNLEELCMGRNIKFVKSFRPFLHKGKPIDKLFAKRDKLHLNQEGTFRLRNFMKKVISHNS